MAGRPVRSVLMDALLNLSKDDLKRFTEELWIREKETRIPRGKVEGKGYRDVANVMVSTLNEKNAVDVAVKIMKSIGCSEEADRLVKKTGGQTSQSTSTDEKHSVDEQLSAQLHKAVTITSDRERFKKILEHLKEPELKEFKWTLEDSNFMFMLDLPNIPRCKLDKADMFDLVDLMIQAYGQRSVEVTKKVFKKMNRNDLVEMMSDSSS